MHVSSAFINLPIRDLQKTRAFWSDLGFTFNEQFSDDKALCMIIKEGSIFAMLITHEFYQTFTNRPIADGSTTQVLLALEVESKERVDEVVQKALKNGAVRYRESADHGWMYYDCFADPDGHQWEIMFSDTSKLTA